MKPISLLVSLNEAYLPQLSVLLTSVRRNALEEQVRLYLLHGGIPAERLAPVAGQCGAYGYQFFPVQVDKSYFSNAPVTRRYPPEMYYRLLSGSFLPREVERVLYLDPDTLVLNSIRPLWELELGDRAMAAAAHTGKTELANNVNRLRLGTDHDYYNSGVLLMDLERCRELVRPDEIFDYVARHGRELLLPDQDVLNALYGTRILPLDDAVWNYDARNYNTYLVASGGARDLSWVMRNTVILHFCGRAKPWKPGYLYRFGVLYLHYADLARRFMEELMPGNGLFPEM